MSLDFPFLNFAVAMLATASPFFAVWVFFRYILGIKLTNVYWKIMAAAMLFFGFVNIWGGMNAPKLTLTGETRPAPVVGGEIQSTAPDKLTDEERLEYNRKLNSENEMNDG
jgi:hypothetical protein